MSNQSPFQPFQFSVNDDVFCTPVGNSEYLSVGVHEVRIESAEFDRGQYGDQFIVNFVNDKGASFKAWISMLQKNKDGETGFKPGYQYLMLGQSILADMHDRVTFLNKQLPINPYTIDCIKNTRVKIEIVEPTKGYTIRDVNGFKHILNLETNEYLTQPVEVEVEKTNSKGEKYTTTETAEQVVALVSFDEAKTYMDAAGLKRAFNKLKKIEPQSAEVQAENAAIMRPVLNQFSGKVAATQPGAPVASKLAGVAAARKPTPARPTV